MELRIHLLCTLILAPFALRYGDRELLVNTFLNSEIKVIGLMNELIMPLRRGTNCLVVSLDLSVSCAESSVSLGLDNEETLHVLGGKWNYVEAELQTQISMRSKPFTGRDIFSVASSVFERLGMLALFVILA